MLGAGAIGGLFARRLARADIPVVLLSRIDRATTRALRFRDDGGESRLVLPQSQLRDTTAIQRLLVTTKAYAVGDALAAVAHRLAPDAEVVVMVNGLGWEPALTASLPAGRRFAASTTAGCHRPAPDLWIPAGAGVTRLGALDDGPEPAWLGAWAAAVPGLEWRPDIRTVLLEKVALNAVINPLTALYDIPNGALLEDGYAAACATSTREVASLLAAAGHRELAQRLPAVVAAVLRDTAGNSSSMRADVQAGRGTEIDAILGYLLTQLPLSAEPPPTPQLWALLSAPALSGPGR